jgi:hypothetical protein
MLSKRSRPFFPNPALGRTELALDSLPGETLFARTPLALVDRSLLPRL